MPRKSCGFHQHYSVIFMTLQCHGHCNQKTRTWAREALRRELWGVCGELVALTPGTHTQQELGGPGAA